MVSFETIVLLSLECTALASCQDITASFTGHSHGLHLTALDREQEKMNTK